MGVGYVGGNGRIVPLVGWRLLLTIEHFEQLNAANENYIKQKQAKPFGNLVCCLGAYLALETTLKVSLNSYLNPANSG